LLCGIQSCCAVNGEGDGLENVRENIEINGDEPFFIKGRGGGRKGIWMDKNEGVVEEYGLRARLRRI
jgi:hypothetical protein